MNNLWNLDEIEEPIEDSPTAILKEQAEYFKESTNNVLYIKIIESEVDAYDINYDMMAEFTIFAPRLSDYTYRLFTVYSNINSMYPVYTTENYNGELREHLDEKDKCQDKDEFIKRISEIIGGDKTTYIVKTLYAKSVL